MFLRGTSVLGNVRFVGDVASCIRRAPHARETLSPGLVWPNSKTMEARAGALARGMVFVIIDFGLKASATMR